MLTKDEVLNILDSISLAYDRLESTLGTGIETGSVSKATLTNFNRIKGLDFTTDYDDLSELLDYSYDSFYNLTNSNIYKFFRNLLVKIYDYTNLNDFLTTNDARIFENIKDMYLQISNGYIISPANILPPPVSNMGTYSIASGTGTFTDGDAIDTSKYGKAFLKLKTTSNIGLNDLTLTITCKKIDNTTEDKQVIIPGNTTQNTEFNIGNGTTDMYIDITNITHSGGNDGDSIQCFSIYERTKSE